MTSHQDSKCLFSCYDLPLYLFLFKANMAYIPIQVNLDMTDSMGPGKLVPHMQNPSYTYDEYLICMGLGPSISSVICKNLLYSGPSYPSLPVYTSPPPPPPPLPSRNPGSGALLVVFAVGNLCNLIMMQAVINLIRIDRLILIIPY